MYLSFPIVMSPQDHCQMLSLKITGVRPAGTLSDKGLETAGKLGTEKSDPDRRE